MEAKRIDSAGSAEAAARQISDVPRGTSLWPDERPPHVWHYTTVDGLMGILGNREIWATDISYLNDISEYSYAGELIKQIVGGLTMSDLVRDMIKIFFEDPREQGIAVYASSFCERPDLLSQWRAYGRNGAGYALRFSLRHLEAAYGAIKPVLGRVEYDINGQRVLLIGSIEHAVAELNKLVTPGQSITAEMNDLLIRRAFLKSDAFSEEKEWRSVSFEDTSSAKTLFRSSKGIIIPYVSVSLEGFDFPVDQVVIGPTLHPVEAKRSLERFLKSKNLSSIEVIASKVPMRA